MSKAYKCDRCGAFFGPGDQGEVKNNPYKVCAYGFEKDLCPECSDALGRWYSSGAERIRIAMEPGREYG